VRSWFERELAVAGFLANRGDAVVPPADELPPGPHERDGLPVTFWRYVQPDPDRQPTVEEAGKALRDLHQALREFPGELPPPVRPDRGPPPAGRPGKPGAP
jgi:hypothetical protein